MTAVPRIYRATATGPVTTAPTPIRVLVTLRWTTSAPTEVLAQAVAWTRTEVQVEWIFNGELRRDWVDASDVRRHGTAPRQPDPAAATTPRPPRLDTRHPRRS